MKKLKQQQLQSQSDSGFTIIESLVALIVAAVLLAAASPVIVLATATRIQSRRVELATQVARSYMDAVRAGAIPAPPAVLGTTTGTAGDFLNAQPVPTAINNPGNYCVNLDRPDLLPTACDPNTPLTGRTLVVQGFRSEGAPTTNDANGVPRSGYKLAVRVYRADGFVNDGSPLRKNSAEGQNPEGARQTARTVTAGLGDRKAPLVEMTTDIVTSGTTFRDLCTRFQGSSGAPAVNSSECSN